MQQQQQQQQQQQGEEEPFPSIPVHPAASVAAAAMSASPQPTANTPLSLPPLLTSPRPPLVPEACSTLLRSSAHTDAVSGASAAVCDGWGGETGVGEGAGGIGHGRGFGGVECVSSPRPVISAASSAISAPPSAAAAAAAAAASASPLAGISASPLLSSMERASLKRPATKAYHMQVRLCVRVRVCVCACMYVCVERESTRQSLMVQNETCNPEAPYHQGVPHAGVCAFQSVAC
jgi:hypothetical protein